ncbi:2094_t:CDS:1, partial [Gigaspora margarita]
MSTLWSWPAESLIIKEFKGNQLIVKRMLVLLNSTSRVTVEQETIQEEDPSSWIAIQM